MEKKKMKKKLKLIFALSALLATGTGAVAVGLLNKEESKDTISNAAITLADANENGFYDISSAEDLSLLANKVSLHGDTEWANASYELTADIDLAGALWTPIGTNANHFSGNFTGNGFTISNSIVIDEAVEGNYYGIFGFVDGAIISDIILDNSFTYTTNSSAVCGNLVGYAQDSIFANIYDNSSSSYSTIGQISALSGEECRVYRGGASLTGGMTVASSITIGQGTPSEEGFVINFDPKDRNGVAGSYTKNSINWVYSYVNANSETITNSVTYKVVVDASGNILNRISDIYSYGTAIPVDEATPLSFLSRAKYHAFDGWLYGDTSDSDFVANIPNTINTLLKDNNYVIRANWREVTYTLDIYDGATKKTSVSKRIDDDWASVVNTMTGLKTGFDLTKVYDQEGTAGAEQTIYQVAVSYDVSGNRYINGDRHDETYLATGLTDGEDAMINYGETNRTVNIYGTWQPTNINASISFVLQNGASQSKWTHSLKYIEDDSAISLDSNNAFTVKAGAPFAYTFTKPYGYKVEIRVNGVVATDTDNVSVTMNSAGYGSSAAKTATINIPNGFTSNTDAIAVVLYRFSQNVSLSGANNLNVALSNNTSYTTYNSSYHTLSVCVDESFTLTFTPKPGYYIAGHTATGFETCTVATQTEDQYVVNYANMIDAPTITMDVANSEVAVSLGYDGDTYASSSYYPNVTVSSGSFSFTAQTATNRNLQIGSDSITFSIPQNTYYNVTGLKVNGSTSGVTKTSGEGVYPVVYTYSPVVRAGSYSATITLEKRNYDFSIGDSSDIGIKNHDGDTLFGGVKDLNGNVVDASTIANSYATVSIASADANSYTISNNSTYATAQLPYGAQVTLSLNLITEYYAFEGWYYENGTLISINPTYTYTAGTSNQKVYAVITGKTATITLGNGRIYKDFYTESNKDGGVYTSGLSRFSSSKYINSISSNSNGSNSFTSFEYSIGNFNAFIKFSTEWDTSVYLDGWAYNTGSGYIELTTNTNPTTITELTSSLTSAQRSALLSSGSITIYPILRQESKTVKVHLYPKDGTVWRQENSSVEDEYVSVTWYNGSNLYPNQVANFGWGGYRFNGYWDWSCYVDNSSLTGSGTNLFRESGRFRIIPGYAFGSYSNINLYPIYTPNTYTVKYYEEDGETQIGETVSLTHYSSSWVVSNVYSNGGYTVTEWENIADSTETYTAGDEYAHYTLKKNLSLKVSAKTASTMFIRVNNNGATTALSDFTMDYNDDILNELASASIAKTGYVLAGWALRDSANSTFYGFGFDSNDLSVSGNTTSFNGVAFEKYVSGASVNLSLENFDDFIFGATSEAGADFEVELVAVWKFDPTLIFKVELYEDSAIYCSWDETYGLSSLTQRVSRYGASDLMNVAPVDLTIANTSKSSLCQKFDNGVWTTVATSRNDLTISSASDSGTYRFLCVVTENNGYYFKNPQTTYTSASFELTVLEPLIKIDKLENSILFRETVFALMDSAKPFFVANSDYDYENVFGGYDPSQTTENKIAYLQTKFATLNDECYVYLGCKSVVALATISEKNREIVSYIGEFSGFTTFSSKENFDAIYGGYTSGIVKIIERFSLLIQKENRNNIWTINVDGVNISDIVVADSMTNVSGINYTFENPKSVSDAPVGYYSNVFFKLNGLTNEMLAGLDAEGSNLIHVESGDFAGYYLKAHKGSAKFSQIKYFEIEDNTLIQVNNNARTMAISVPNVVYGSQTYAATLNLATASGAAGAYLLLDETLSITSIVLSDGTNAYTLVRNGSTNVWEFSGSAPAGVDPQAWDFWTNDPINIIAKADAYVESLEIRAIQANSNNDGVETSSDNYASTTITITEIDVTYGGNNYQITSNSGIVNNNIYLIANNNRTYIGQLIGNGTTSPSISLLSVTGVTITGYKYSIGNMATYQVSGTPYAYKHLGNYTQSAASESAYEAALQALSAYSATGEVAVGSLSVGTEVSRWVVISKASAVEIYDGSDLSDVAFVNISQPTDISGVITAQKTGYDVDALSVKAGNISTSGTTATVNDTLLKTEVSINWYPSLPLSIYLVTDMESISASEDGTTLSASDYVSSVTGFDSSEYTVAWEATGTDSLTLNNTSQAGSYTIVVTLNNFREKADSSKFVTGSVSLPISIEAVELDFAGNVSVGKVSGGANYNYPSRYSNENKLSTNQYTFYFNNYQVSKIARGSVSGDDFVTFTAYGDSTCETPITIAKDAGTYYFKIELDTTVYSYNTSSTYYDSTVGAYVYSFEITPYEYELQSGDVSLSKYYGFDDPTLATTHYPTGVYAPGGISVTFTRDAGNSVGTYDLYVDSVSDSNCNITIPANNGWFEILPLANATLIVNLEEDFAITYDGSEITDVVMEWDGVDHFDIVAYANSTEKARAEVSFKYTAGGEQHNVADPYTDLYNSFANGDFTFAISNAQDAGSYEIAATGSDTTFDDIMVNQLARFVINQKALTITAFEKEFDATTDFVYGEHNATATISGLVFGDSVGFTATYASAGTAAEISNATAINVTNIEIDNSNYALTSTSATGIVVKNTYWELTDIGTAHSSKYEYGQITNSNSSDYSFFEDNLTILNSTGMDVKDYLVGSISFVNVDYSTGGYLTCSYYNPELTFTSDYMTCVEGSTYQVNIQVERKDLVVSVSVVDKTYDGTNALAEDADVSFAALAGDDVDCAVEYVQYSKGTNIGFSLTPSGDDCLNYNFINNQVGNITDRTFVLTLAHTGFDFVEDGLSVSAPQTISIPFTEQTTGSAAYAILDGIEISRTGYDFEGWYADNARSNLIGSGNIISFLEENARESTVYIYSNWTIQGFSLIVVVSDENGYEDETRGTIETTNSALSFDYYTPVTVTATANDNFVFVGFNGASGATVNDNVVTISHFTDDFDITAKFRYVTVNIVGFSEGNEYTTITRALDHDDIQTNDAFTILSSLVPAKTGHHISAFTYVNNGRLNQGTSEQLINIIEQINGSSVYEDDSTFNFTAEWEANTYTVTLHTNYPQGANEEVDTTVTYAEALGDATNYAEPEYTAYKFTGWNTLANGTGDGYTSETIYTLDDNLELYAQWELDELDVEIVLSDIEHASYQVLLNTEGNIWNQIDPKQGYEHIYSFNAGSTYKVQIVVSEGYEFEFVYSDYDFTSVEEDGNSLILERVLDATEIDINVCARENRVQINEGNFDLTSVIVDGVSVSTANRYDFTADTDTTIVITAVAHAGYTLNMSGTEFSVENINVDGFTANTITISGFTTNFEITISVTPNTYLATIIRDDGKIASISAIGGTPVDEEGVLVGFNVTTGQPLELQVTTKYGYKNPIITSVTNGASFDGFVVTGFTDEFTINLDAEKEEYSVGVNLVSVDNEDNVQTESANSVSVKQGGVSVTKALYLTTVNYTAVSNEAGYVFQGWYADPTISNGKLTSYGSIVSTESNYDHEVVGNVLYYAIFKLQTYSVEANAAEHGTLDFDSESGESASKVTSYTRTLYHGDTITLVANPDRGYTFVNWTDGNGDEVSAEQTYEFSLSSDINVTANFVAGTGEFSVENILYMNGVKVADQSGNFAKVNVGSYNNETGIFTPKTGAEADKSKDVEFKTDEDVYLQFEIYKGYEFGGLSSEVAVGKTNVTTEEIRHFAGEDVVYYIYRIYNLNSENDYATLISRINAIELNVTINFKNNGNEADAGRINVENGFGIFIDGNGSSKAKVKAVTGNTVVVTASVRFNFALVSEGDKVASSAGNLRNIVVDDQIPTTSGFSSQVDFEITDFNTDLTVTIYVTSEKYNINFYNEGSLIEGASLTDISVGETLDVTSIRTILEEFSASRPGYAFTGFYTAQSGSGEMYIDEALRGTQPWSETGYRWNGAEYETVSNYNSSTRTFNLYAGWERNKTAITIMAVPSRIATIDPTVAAKNVITSINNSNAWLDADNAYFADILYGADIVIKAPYYDGYLFSHWLVYLDGELNDQIEDEVYTKVGGFRSKDALIVAVYKAKVEISATDGGSAKLIQGDTIIENGNADYLDTTLSFTLSATPVVGYTFTGWYNKVTDELISNLLTYVYQASSENEFLTMEIEARFEGNEVTVSIGEYDDTNGRVEKVIFGGEEKTDAFSAKVGEEVELWVSIRQDEDSDKQYGVKWNLKGINFERFEYSDDFELYYVYRYVIDGEDVNDAKVIITPEFTEQTITIEFDISLNGDPDYSVAGYVTIPNIRDNRVELSFGQPLTLTIDINTNYTIKYIQLDGVNMMEFFDGTTLTIPSSYLIRNLDDDERVFIVKIVFAQNLWIAGALPSELPGNGTRNDPYQISNARDLAFVAYMINVLNNKDYASANYILKKDIDLVGKFWVPIGTEDTPFNGYFNFDGFKIFGITLQPGIEEEGLSYSGVFGDLGANAGFLENNIAKKVIIISTSAAAGVVAIGVTTFFIVRARRKKRIEKLANN